MIIPLARLVAVAAMTGFVSGLYDVSKIQYERVPLHTMEVEIEACEGNPSCGGLLFRPNGDIEDQPTSSQETTTRQVRPEELPDLEGHEFFDEDGNLLEQSQVEELAAQGLLLLEEAKEEESIGVARLLFVPVYYNDDHEEVFVSSKKWLIQRGSVTIPARDYRTTVITSITQITVEDARSFCNLHPTCIAFSFPLQTQQENGMTALLDEVIFVNQIAGFDVGPASYAQEYEVEEEDLEKDASQVEWMTHIVHDREKLAGRIKKHMNLADTQWRKLATTPYRPCCHAAEELPTIEQVQTMDTLPRVPCNISRSDFYEQYEKTRTPVMLVGCDTEWPAHKKWRDIPTLLNRFDNHSTWDAPSEMTWGEFQDYYTKDAVHDRDSSFRVFYQLNPGYRADEVHKDYQVPLPFQGADMFSMVPKHEERTFPPGFGAMHWFLFGSYGTGTGPHVDPHTTDAWNTLVHGHKWWIIYPKGPRVITESETKCYARCSDRLGGDDVHSSEEVAWYNSVGRHAHKMYYGQDEAAMQVLQGPGETIYVPYGMMHSVLNMDDTIAITQNYGAPGNLEEVWREVLSSGEDMDWKRLYFQMLDKDTRRRVRNVLWPITQEGRKGLPLNQDLYKGEMHASDIESESSDEDLEIISDEEFNALSPEEQAQVEYLYEEAYEEVEEEVYEYEEEYGQEEEYEYYDEIEDEVTELRNRRSDVYHQIK